jgi:phage terminase large subunit-like protein
MDHQRPFHASTAKGRAFIGGNRSGKTVAGAAEIVFWLKGEHPLRPVPVPPVRARGIAVDFDHGVELIMKPEIARWVPPSLLIDGSWDKSYSRQLRQLTLSNGSTLEFLSYDQDLDKHAGTSRHIIWFDEEPPKDIFNENMARLIDVGGSYVLTMTPVEGMTWVFDDIYMKAKNGDPFIDVFEAAMDMNIHINVTEIEAYLGGMTKEEKDARRQGKFVQLGGLVYGGKYFTEKNILPSLYSSGSWASVRDNWKIFTGMDHGFRNPTCWLWGAYDKNGRIIIFDEYYRSDLVAGAHAEQIHERNRLLSVEPEYNVGDPSIRNTDPITGTSVLLEYQEHGLTINLANNDVSAGINRVARMFENSLLMVTENCEKLIWELNRYRWAKWSNRRTDETRNPKDEPVKKDDHACDALRYMVASRPVDDMVGLDERVLGPLGYSEALRSDRERVDTDLISVPDTPIDPYLGGEW